MMLSMSIQAVVFDIGGQHGTYRVRPRSAPALPDRDLEHHAVLYTGNAQAIRDIEDLLAW